MKSKTTKRAIKTYTMDRLQNMHLRCAIVMPQIAFWPILIKNDATKLKNAREIRIVWLTVVINELSNHVHLFNFLLD